MKKKEQLFFRNIKIRASEETENTGRMIEGIIPYNSRSVPMWGTTEIIAPSAFRKTLNDNANVFALIAHDTNKVLGSTRAGTLELINSEDGLICRCGLPNTSYGNDAWEIIKRGDVSTMSFGFRPIKWTDENNERTLREVALEEVSFCVPFPAYEETDSKILRGFLRMKIDSDVVNEILEKEEPDEKDIAVLTEVVNSLNAVIAKNKPETEEEPKSEAEPEGKSEETSNRNDTSPGGSAPEKESKDKEAIKQEINDLIDLLFEIEKTSPKEESSGNTENEEE
jgi:HK97 family phage prohead protease